MKKLGLKNKLIVYLESNLQNGVKDSVYSFLSYLKNIGTPMIEKSDDDPDHYFVTFIYAGDSSLANVLFYGDFQPDITASNIDEFKMDNIA